MWKWTSKEKLFVQNLSWPLRTMLLCRRGQQKNIFCEQYIFRSQFWKLVNGMPIFEIRCWNWEILLKRRFLLHDKNMKLFAGFLSGLYKSTYSALGENGSPGISLRLLSNCWVPLPYHFLALWTSILLTCVKFRIFLVMFVVFLTWAGLYDLLKT